MKYIVLAALTCLAVGSKPGLVIKSYIKFCFNIPIDHLCLRVGRGGLLQLGFN